MAEHLFDPAKMEDLSATISVARDVLDRLQGFLVDRGELIRITSDVVLSAVAIPAAVKKLAHLFDTDGAFSASQAKDVLGTTRKFAIPLLEYLDKQGWTRRNGDRREIRQEKLEELS